MSQVQRYVSKNVNYRNAYIKRPINVKMFNFVFFFYLAKRSILCRLVILAESELLFLKQYTCKS